MLCAFSRCSSAVHFYPLPSPLVQIQSTTPIHSQFLLSLKFLFLLAEIRNRLLFIPAPYCEIPKLYLLGRDPLRITDRHFENSSSTAFASCRKIRLRLRTNTNRDRSVINLGSIYGIKGRTIFINTQKLCVH